MQIVRQNKFNGNQTVLVNSLDELRQTVPTLNPKNAEIEKGFLSDYTFDQFVNSKNKFKLGQFNYYVKDTDTCEVHHVEIFNHYQEETLYKIRKRRHVVETVTGIVDNLMCVIDISDIHNFKVSKENIHLLVKYLRCVIKAMNMIFWQKGHNKFIDEVYSCIVKVYQRAKNQSLHFIVPNETRAIDVPKLGGPVDALIYIHKTYGFPKRNKDNFIVFEK